jgi:hypothetical protein
MTRKLPLADPDRERLAKELFPIDVTPDEYAARTRTRGDVSRSMRFAIGMLG